MKPIKKFMGLLIIFLSLIFVSAFFGDGLLFFLATTDDKIYGDENRFIDTSLTGDALTSDNNIKDSYKFTNETDNWLLLMFKFFMVVIKLFGIILLPLLLYFLFVAKDTNLPDYINNIFQKE